MEQSLVLDPNLISDINISVLASIYALLLSVVSAYLVRTAYIKYGKSLNNREYFGNVFLLLATVTCAVIIIVKYSLALSLGLVGALSIVRFRAAIKEPEELVYLFLVIGLGIAYGSNQFLIGLLLLVISLGVIYISARSFSRKQAYSQTGAVLIISGHVDAIEKWRKEELGKLTISSETIILKELDLNDENSRLVLKTSLTDQFDDFLNQISESTRKSNLSLNFISDISVPE